MSVKYVLHVWKITVFSSTLILSALLYNYVAYISIMCCTLVLCHVHQCYVFSIMSCMSLYVLYFNIMSCTSVLCAVFKHCALFFNFQCIKVNMEEICNILCSVVCYRCKSIKTHWYQRWVNDWHVEWDLHTSFS
jgi:hypothetical protein